MAYNNVSRLNVLLKFSFQFLDEQGKPLPEEIMTFTKLKDFTRESLVSRSLTLSRLERRIEEANILERALNQEKIRELLSNPDDKSKLLTDLQQAAEVLNDATPKIGAQSSEYFENVGGTGRMRCLPSADWFDNKRSEMLKTALNDPMYQFEKEILRERLTYWLEVLKT